MVGYRTVQIGGGRTNRPLGPKGVWTHPVWRMRYTGLLTYAGSGSGEPSSHFSVPGGTHDRGPSVWSNRRVSGPNLCSVPRRKSKPPYLDLLCQWLPLEFSLTPFPRTGTDSNPSLHHHHLRLWFFYFHLVLVVLPDPTLKSVNRLRWVRSLLTKWKWRWGVQSVRTCLWTMWLSNRDEPMAKSPTSGVEITLRFLEVLQFFFIRSTSWPYKKRQKMTKGK